MDRIGTRADRGGDDRVAAQVRLGRRRPAERDRHVDRIDVQCVGVGLGVHADGLDAETRGGAGDADGDLTPVGDEQSFDRCAAMWRCGHQCLHTPYSVAPAMTLLCAAARAIPITVRESAGWMIPSSQIRPVE